MVLADEIHELARGCAQKAKANYFAAYALITIAVASSTAATIAVAAGALTKELNAVLAALPGIIVLATTTFKFEARSDWWWAKHQTLEALYRGLKYEERVEKEVSQEMTAFLKKHEEKWPSFGKAPGA